MFSIARYLFLWLSITASLLALVAVFNLLVDPYRFFQFLDKPGFNHIKPKAGPRGAVIKKYLVLRVNPKGLILGNSRAEVGFDPLYTAWPHEVFPVFNYALPGTGTSTSLASLKSALNDQKKDQVNRLKTVVLGLDYMDFLTEKRISPRRNLDSAKTKNPKESIVQTFQEYLEPMFTMGALLDSVQTLLNQDNPYSADLTALGFNPMRDYIKISSDEGYWAVFRAKDIEGIKAYLQRPRNIVNDEGRSSALSDLREIINLCMDNGIALHLVMYPYHAHLLETFRITGHWSNYEAWKRMIMHVVDAASQNSRVNIALWDFSGFNSLTTEEIPNKDDRKSRMHWYWEAGHFKRELGDVILDSLFGRQTNFPDFGILLNKSNFEGHIASIRQQGIHYRREHSEEIIDLESIATEIIKSKRINSER